MNKTKLAAYILHHGGLLPAARWLQKSGIVVFGYHRIRPNGPNPETPFDPAVFGPTQEAFAQQVKWLKQNFDVVSEAELLSLARKLRKGRYAVITFDDGYSDNYTLAYPVLRTLFAPAIFFVCPDLIENRRVGWWDLIHYLVRQTRKSEISVRGRTFPTANRQAATGELLDWMKLWKAADTATLMDDLAQACEVEMPPGDLQDAQLMTWAQLEEVSTGGVAIGSHTHTHRVLATLTEEEQRWELGTSKKVLEGRIPGAGRTLAYPVGGYKHFTAGTMRIARECGYQGAFSFHTGGNSASGLNPYNLCRIAPTSRLDGLFTCGAILPDSFTWSHPVPATHVGPI